MSLAVSSKYTINCLSCKPLESAARRMVLNSDTCAGSLRTDQHGSRGWLGRAVYFVKGHLSSEQALEISKDRRRCEVMHFMACERLFKDTNGEQKCRGNYAEAGNKNMDEAGKPTPDHLYHHPHTHVIPRYLKEVEWRGKKFKDHTFYDAMELNPTPSEKEKKLNAEGNVNIALIEDEVYLLKTDIQEVFVRMIFDKQVPEVFRPKWEEIENAFPADSVKKLYFKLKSEQ